MAEELRDHLVTIGGADYLDTAGLMDRYGAAERTVAGWRKAGRVEFVKWNGVCLYPLAELEAQEAETARAAQGAERRIPAMPCRRPDGTLFPEAAAVIEGRAR